MVWLSCTKFSSVCLPFASLPLTLRAGRHRGRGYRGVPCGRRRGTPLGSLQAPRGGLEHRHQRAGDGAGALTNAHRSKGFDVKVVCQVKGLQKLGRLGNAARLPACPLAALLAQDRVRSIAPLSVPEGAAIEAPRVRAWKRGGHSFEAALAKSSRSVSRWQGASFFPRIAKRFHENFQGRPTSSIEVVRYSDKRDRPGLTVM